MLRFLFATAFFLSLSDLTYSESPEFGRDVRPILSDHCFACHGPDEEHREADLRLDTEAGLLAAIESADADTNALIERITSDDSDSLMPPPKFGKPLSTEQIDTLKNWVRSGAKYSEHWAFVTPVKQFTNEKGQTTSADAINHFVDDELNRVSLKPNGEADPRTLARRVCFDLTGLPPTPEELAEFLADDSPGAYERYVDRLLASPHFGEHVGRYWLDLVRYGDTHGLHLDNYREMWLYRDWVIDAFNSNMPMDQFIIEQLAGDLLPESTVSQKVASGFNRLNVSTNEGGSIVEEVAARNVIDRTDAFGTIFLGLTTGCSVCHDHKFDPLTMKEYYSLSAFFNSLDGNAMDGNIKDHPPSLSVNTPEQTKQLAEFDEFLDELRNKKNGPITSVDQAQDEWERTFTSIEEPTWTFLKPQSATSEAKVEMKIRDDGGVEVAGATAANDVTTIVANLPPNQPWKSLRLEALVDDPNSRVGLSSNGNVVLSEIVLEMQHGDDPSHWTPVPIGNASADIEQQNGPFAVRFAIDGKVNDSEGWAVAGYEQTGPRTAWFDLGTLFSETNDAKLRVQLKYKSKYAEHQFRLVRLGLSTALPKHSKTNQIVRGSVHSAGPFPVAHARNSYSQKFASEQGSFKAEETFTFDGRRYGWQLRGDLPEVVISTLASLAEQSSVNVIHQTLTAETPQTVSLLIGTTDGHVIFLNGKQIGISEGEREIQPLEKSYALDLKKGANDLYVKVVNHSGKSQFSYALQSPLVKVSRQLAELLNRPASDRSASERETLRKYYRSVYCTHPDWQVLIDQEKGTLAAIETIRKETPTTLIWKELAKPRKAHILLRGAYDQPGEVVERATPAFLPPMDSSLPNDRLGLARWLVSDSHPLTARVAVNRFWQQVFGTGLVKTSEDFGSQGEPPSHPELLDWLAVDFRENRWDVKRLLKAIVMSDVYRRSSMVKASQLRIDPRNRLLSRGPRFRLDGEMLRDQALAVSGLLVDQLGGPSVKPPQPPGLWEAVGYSGSNTVRFTPDSGEKIHRRSVYIFWKRTSAPPQMSTFDAPSRESCTARRERTNTPLQALLLMNEPQYLAASKKLAERVLAEQTLPNDRSRVEWLFEKVTTRIATREETDELLGLFSDMAKLYESQLTAAEKLTGESSASLAGWMLLSSTLLNLDEVVNK